MKKKNIIRIAELTKCLLIIGCVALASLSVLGQDSQSTSNTADKNLKSSARVNPSTRAMEFSIPLFNYPGRGGNSMPIVLNYSSKVWDMKMTNFRHEFMQVPTTQYYDYIAYESTDVSPIFGDKTLAGWTSSLQPVTLVEDNEIYNESGETIRSDYASRRDCGDSLSPIEGWVCYWVTSWFYYNESCAGNTGYHTVEYCVNTSTEAPEIAIRETDSCAFGPAPTPYLPIPTPTPVETPVPPQPGSTPLPQIPHQVHRLRVETADGASHEFRKDDKVYNCNNFPGECSPNNDPNGTYLSVDGTGMRLEKGAQVGEEIRDILYLPNGSKYIFPVQSSGGHYDIAEKFVDKDGNVATYAVQKAQWTDTLGRKINDPMVNPWFTGQPLQSGGKTYSVDGLNGSPVSYVMNWNNLGNVLESENTDLKYLGDDSCQSVQPSPITGDSLFQDQDVLITPDPDPIENRVKYIRRQRTCALSSGEPSAFNPVVLDYIKLPDGRKYEFKYNEYGEITKIIYPTGSYERFEYEKASPIGFTAPEVYNQANRGVKKRYVSFDGDPAHEQVWEYTDTTITAPDGTSTETSFQINNSTTLIQGFGFNDPRSGMVQEQKTRDANGVLRSRTINDWVTTPPRDSGAADRDPRLKRSVTIVFDPNSTAALATLNEIDYDDSGSSDPEFFSHLNVKRKKSYNYAVIGNKTTVDDEALNWTTITGWFSGKLAAVSETDYWYDTDYHARGFNGLPYETRVLDPADGTTVLAKTNLFYDNFTYSSAGSPSQWVDPGSDLRGNVTVTRSWLKDPIAQTETNIDVVAQYDTFGNLIKTWDAAGNMTETQYSSTYNYAYPTKVIAPAPDTSGTHGTNQTSSAETTYDLTTGLVLSVKDDYGQITKMEYNDPLLRPTRVYADNYSGPQSVTEYTDTPDGSGRLSVKVKKQIDETNWDEATTFMDKSGRTLQSEAKDSQGDVFVDTHYDSVGRVDRVTNPYRSGDTVYWNKSRFDELSRAVESYAPAIMADITNNNLTSLGMSSFAFSTSGDIGTVAISTDASGRKGRSITNALGQLIRVDEPTAFGGTADQDLGTIASPAQPTYYTYSKLGQMVKVAQGAQNRYFLYDNLGRLLRIKQPEQEANTGLAFSDPVSGNSSWSAGFTYDIRGSVLTATDAKGTVITNAYDNAGRVKTRSYSNEPSGISTPQVDYYYDGVGVSGASFAKGKLTKVSSSVSETRYTNFDHMGRVLSSEQITDGQTYPLSYKYNLSGALTEETYPSGEVVRNFLETDGDLSRVAMSGRTYISDFNYTASGGITALKLGNGTWETALFNSRQQVTQLGLGTASNNTSLWKVNYDYGELQTNGTVDAAKNTGNIAKQTLTIPNTSFVQAYKYDSLYRLTEAKETTSSSQNWIQNFTYDRFGNRTGFSQQMGSLTINTTPAVDTNTNRFSSGFVYDKNGNITQDGQGGSVRAFVFDGENKQTQVKDAGSNPIGTYFYDGGGKRVKKTTNTGEVTVFVYDGMGKLVAEYSNQSSSSPTISFTTTDHLGSPRVVTDKGGTVISRRDFMPFGEELNAGTPSRAQADKYALASDTLRKKFTGYEKDAETGLDFAEARYYNNAHGRFTAIDPLLTSGKSANPQTFNRYSYTSNNPITRVDRTGLDWYKEAWTTQNGVVIYRPVWKPHNSDGNRWHEAGYLTYKGTTFNVQGESFAFKDTLTGKYWAYDFFENRPGAQFNTLEEANAQTAAWEKQAGANFVAGFLSQASFAFEVAGGSKAMGAEEWSEAFQVGQRAGVGATVVSLFTGGGLVNAALSKLPKGAVTIFKGVTVLGHNPKYLEVAERLGANVFDVPLKVWKKWSGAEKWAANRAFLDDAIAAGHEFILATPLRDGESWFRREVDYLLEHGYIYNADKTKLIRNPGVH